MRLRELLAGVRGVRVLGTGDELEILDVRDDSRLVAHGDLFVAIPGTVTQGAAFVSNAIARGAAAVVVEEGAAIPDGFRGAVVTVPNARRALAAVAANRFGAARQLTLSAVTGTNGKTTITHLFESMLEAAGIRAGVIGTIAYRVGGGGGSRAAEAPVVSRPAPLTTPGALAMHALFAEMRDAGAKDVVLEASSHALHQDRLYGCRFRVAGFTNLTQDHLDYHGNLDDYFEAKAILFEQLLEPESGVGVVPIDRPEGQRMRKRVRGRALTVATTPGTAGADLVVEGAELGATGIRARLATPLGRLDIASSFVGDYNLENIVLAVGMAVGRGLPLDAIAAGTERLAGVPGRLERVNAPAGVLCVVDYAHTPDALERALAALRPLVGQVGEPAHGGDAPNGSDRSEGGGRLIVVFGCGGDRDRTKRPLMGGAAARDADLAIVTSDNPRTEDPKSIVDMIVAGVRTQGGPELTAAQLSGAARGFHVEVDRKLAIHRAAAAARPGDVVLIAGKGHEDYQIVGTTRLAFDDRREAEEAFRVASLSSPRASAVKTSR